MSKTGFRITDLWAYVAVHQDGDEGIIAGKVNGQPMPLIAADLTRLNLLRPYAEEATRVPGVTGVKLVKFTQRVELEEL